MKMRTVIAGTAIAGEVAAMRTMMNLMIGVIMAGDAADMMKMMKMNMGAATSGAVVTKTKVMTKMIIGKERVMMKMMTTKTDMIGTREITHVAAATRGAREEDSVA
jgi:hypothetical protein